MDDWKVEMDREFAQAVSARERGNEGQARVCARRAAGVAVREYFRRRGGLAVRSASAYQLLQELAGFDAAPADARQAAEYLTLRVTEAFKLPAEVDLILAARTLCERLLPGCREP